MNDAEAFLALSKKLDEETKFMMLEPGERDLSVERQSERIQGFIETHNHKLLVVDSGSELVGYISAIGGAYRRNFHKAHVILGILQSYAGKGVGTRLFRQLENWAKDNNLHRLELMVMTHNERAIALYKKIGFSIEGEIKHSLFIDGEYVDEFSMFKIINQENAEQSHAPDASTRR